MSYAERDRSVSPEMSSATDRWCCPGNGEAYLLRNPGPVNGGLRGGRNCAAEYIEKKSHEQAPPSRGALDHTHRRVGPVHGGVCRESVGPETELPVSFSGNRQSRLLADLRYLQPIRTESFFASSLRGSSFCALVSSAHASSVSPLFSSFSPSMRDCTRP